MLTSHTALDNPRKYIVGVLTMDEKLTGKAYFMRDARRIGDLEAFRRERIKKRSGGKAYVVEKIIELESIDFENLSTDLLADRQYIADNRDLMFSGNNNVWHCILIVQRGKSDVGILVESKKMEFPMFAALYQKRTGNKFI